MTIVNCGLTVCCSVLRYVSMDGCKVRKIGSFVSILNHLFSKHGQTDIDLRRRG